MALGRAGGHVQCRARGGGGIARARSRLASSGCQGKISNHLLYSKKLHVDLTGQGSRGKRHRGKAESPETEGVQTTPTLGVFPTKCCRPPPRPISHFLSASVFLKRQKQGPGRGEAGPRSRSTGGRPAPTRQKPVAESGHSRSLSLAGFKRVAA